MCPLPRPDVYKRQGEQQRIAIARVMLKNAPIIILDEATAFADPDNESRVQAAFLKLSEGKTVIMIAHRLSTVTNVDQIFVIQDGQVAECGNSRESVSYTHLYENGRLNGKYVFCFSGFLLVF